MKNYIFVIAFLTSIVSFGQDHFLVELEDRSPDVATLVRSYEGMPLIPMLANDINGKEHFLGDYKGETLVLFFWKKDMESCTKLLPVLGELQDSLDNFNVLSFATDQKADLIPYAETNDIKFPIIPNSEILSEGPYGGELGYPKLFFIDQWGIIKWVFPASEINRGIDMKKILTILHKQKVD